MFVEGESWLAPLLAMVNVAPWATATDDVPFSEPAVSMPTCRSDLRAPRIACRSGQRKLAGSGLREPAAATYGTAHGQVRRRGVDLKHPRAPAASAIARLLLAVDPCIPRWLRRWLPGKAGRCRRPRDRPR